MDYIKVIILGHMVKQPLMCRSSELVDGSEPHGLLLSVRAATGCMTAVHGGEEVYPGWCKLGGAGRVLYRVPSQEPARGQI